MMTIELRVQMDTFRRVNPDRLAWAVARVIEHTLDNDIEGAEILNRETIGQVSVETGITLTKAAQAALARFERRHDVKITY